MKNIYDLYSTSKLTNIDMRVIQLISKGYDNKFIAKLTHRSLSTIKNRTKRILEILGMNNRVQIAIYYLENYKYKDFVKSKNIEVK